jgi:hypothetical protein
MQSSFESPLFFVKFKADSVDSEKTALMYRLIWIYTGRTWDIK